METPRARFVAATPEAAEALQHDAVTIREFPFRVGRESRFALVHGRLRSVERRRGKAPPNNDLYLIDRGEFLNISREHFQIERDADGAHRLVDRGSTCGTLVDDQAVGGDGLLDSAPLKHGCVIRVGTAASPYVFRFEIDPPPAA